MEEHDPYVCHWFVKGLKKLNSGFRDGGYIICVENPNKQGNLSNP